MPTTFVCPHCGRCTNVSDQYAGQTGPCVECGQQVTVAAQDGCWKCPRCGAPIAMDATACQLCEASFGGTAPGGSLGDDAAIRMLIPVGRSALAIAAGYAGLLSVLLFPAIGLGMLRREGETEKPKPESDRLMAM